MKVSFYNISIGIFDKTVARLLNKIYTFDNNAVLLLKNEQQIEFYNSLLWTFSSGVFLPHGCSKDYGDYKSQPICLTAVVENPNDSDIIVNLTDKVITDESTFKNIIDIFDGNDANNVSNAQNRWKDYKNKAYTMVYWQQNEQGVWGKKFG